MHISKYLCINMPLRMAFTNPVTYAITVSLILICLNGLEVTYVNYVATYGSLKCMFVQFKIMLNNLLKISSIDGYNCLQKFLVITILHPFKQTYFCLYPN